MNAATLLKVEALKASRRRPIVYFTIAVVMIALITVLPDYISAKRHHEPVSVIFPDVWPMLVRGPAAAMTTFILAIVIVMTVASEFMWKTSRQNVIDGLAKNQWFAAKLLISAALLLLFTFLLIATGALVALLSPFTDFIRWQDVKMFRGFLLALLGQAAIAFSLAMTVRKDGPALGLYLLWPPLEVMLSFLVSRIHRGWGEILRYLPMHATMENLNPAYWDASRAATAAEIASRSPLGSTQQLSAGANQALTLAYVALFIGLAFWNYRRRDL